MRICPLLGGAMLAAGLSRPCHIVAQTAGPAATFLIHDAMILDGTGVPAVRGSVRVSAGRIAAVGDLTPARGEPVIDAHGLTLTPGFIDNHSHADEGFAEHPDALGAVNQGITTVVVGQDGFHPFPLAGFFAGLEKDPVAVNVAAYAGHNTVRDLVLRQDFRREASPEEIGRMKYLLRQEFRAGALGLSTGLEYDPGIYSSRAEVLALARVAAEFKTRYISHIRSEDRYFWNAIDEIITIGRETGMPVQISHTKLAMRSNWGLADSLIRLLDSARASGVKVTADMYPYPYWHSTLTVLFPDRNFEDRAAAEFAVTQVSTPDGLLLDHYQPTPEFAGHTVGYAARQLGVDSVSALIELVRRIHLFEREQGTVDEGVIGTSMIEPDIERLMRWEQMSFCTDGELAGGHPRGFGSYTRVLGRYVRERQVLPLETAIYKASGLAADHMGITDRGRIAAGMAADLVLLDPGTVIDHATPEDPHAVSSGIERVWVNGVVVFESGKATGARPGVVLRRKD